MTNENTNLSDNRLLFEALSRYRFLGVDQVEALLDGRMPDIAALQSEKTIHTLDAPNLSGKRRTVLALARRGAERLALAKGEEVQAFPYVIPSRLKRSLFTIEHTLCINQVGVVLERLQRRLFDFTILDWETVPQRIGTSILIRKPGDHLRVPLVADAFFGVRWGKECPWFLLEVDRGTVSLKRMALKFQGYLNWWKQDGPKARFGVKNLRLLVLCPNERRMLRLQEAVRSCGIRSGRGFVWFALQDIVDSERPESFLKADWRKAARSSRRYSLFRTCPEP